ncbi:Repressor of filamentous growth 1 [Hypsizygus marmoreus]|uniref:Repressor of filamentous growth 1 n=1 Tax=Hypsizygus marmoreus TaxID=39966 RepID=A0A369KAB2_HYPMA|nr:Repressor of filamentous growth 1 [Hypsizygus marmoreus]
MPVVRHARGSQRAPEDENSHQSVYSRDETQQTDAIGSNIPDASSVRPLEARMPGIALPRLDSPRTRHRELILHSPHQHHRRHTMGIAARDVSEIPPDSISERVAHHSEDASLSPVGTLSSTFRIHPASQRERYHETQAPRRVRELTLPSLPQEPGPRRGRHDEDHVRRPRNAFIVFRSQYYKHFLDAGTSPSSFNGTRRDQTDISRDAADAWNRLTADEREPYVAQAHAERAEHARMYPDYHYAPGARPKKRRSRKTTTTHQVISMSVEAQIQGTGPHGTIDPISHPPSSSQPSQPAQLPPPLQEVPNTPTVSPAPFANEGEPNRILPSLPSFNELLESTRSAGNAPSEQPPRRVSNITFKPEPVGLFGTRSSTPLPLIPILFYIRPLEMPCSKKDSPVSADEPRTPPPIPWSFPAKPSALEVVNLPWSNADSETSSSDSHDEAPKASSHSLNVSPPSFPRLQFAAKNVPEAFAVRILGLNFLTI